MKERPILFNDAMVRAILEGRKTQTRRIIKPQPGFIESSGRWYWEKALDVNGRPLVDASLHWWEYYGTSPYGQVGDRLWVREAIRLIPDQEPDDGSGPVHSMYAADGSLTVADAWPWKRACLRAMYCPRGLSRITLEITGVRVERLQDINVSDAWAEGISDDEILDCNGSVEAFQKIWKSIYGHESWSADPWVWVIEFKRVTP